MNFLIHLGYTLVLSRILYLDYPELILALIFGVFLDFDHIFRYIPKLINEKKLLPTNTYMKTFIQEPVFYPVILVLSFILKTYIPLIFFTLHLVLDYPFVNNNRPLYPLNNFEIKGIFNFKTKVYWIFTISSIIFFIIIFSINKNYNYFFTI